MRPRPSLFARPAWFPRMPVSSVSNRRIRRGLLLLVAIVVLGVVGYVLAGWNLLDAIYMVVITILAWATARCVRSRHLLSRCSRSP
jgi:hypothetical protein